MDPLLSSKARIPRRRHRHVHRRQHPHDDPREDVGEDVGVSGDFPVQLATGIASGNRSRVSDVSARILARMSVSVSVSWNSSLIPRTKDEASRDVFIEQLSRLKILRAPGVAYWDTDHYGQVPVTSYDVRACVISID